MNYAPDFVKYILDDEKYIMADVLENTNCHRWSHNSFAFCC